MVTLIVQTKPRLQTEDVVLLCFWLSIILPMPRIDAAHDEHEKSENPHEERFFIEVGPHRSRRIKRMDRHINRPDDDTDEERAHEQATEATE